MANGLRAPYDQTLDHAIPKPGELKANCPPYCCNDVAEENVLNQFMPKLFSGVKCAPSNLGKPCHHRSGFVHKCIVMLKQA